MLLFLRNLEFYSTFLENRNSGIFLICFLIKNFWNFVNILQFWVYFIKKYKIRNRCHRNAAKKLWHFVKSPREEINFKTHPYVGGLKFFRQTQFLGSIGIKSKRFWQWALVLYECHHTPPPFPPSSPTKHSYFSSRQKHAPKIAGDLHCRTV